MKASHAYRTYLLITTSDSHYIRSDNPILIESWSLFDTSMCQACWYWYQSFISMVNAL